ncbi:maltose alpha-D-glucosyltransferase [Polyangium aurulentum]|uniref:maltose alpha-D-glucosyltransferase n=1 Tax=Polyangium aurulentum TaxID=2567896 RepID=UPI0010AEE5D9|nr:maltose alpha-D-glucosyltransferase [Polyangium aurulentum]UQA60958.1 maltose alpha-D-glucosyltransferase [Polyangium aurulentum]
MRHEKTAEGLANPFWYKDAVIYEIHIRAFSDSNGDGIGDISGLIDKLDYLHDLGVTAIWLLPFYPSPLRDGGYDIADYTDINPAYGTREEFARLMREAHRRDIRVITELVLNHTSSEHAWFQRARNAPPGSPHRDFYVWSDNPTLYSDARIIFKDFETSNWSWDPVAKAYYWHRFYAHQPDLNFDNPAVHEALLRVVDFWFEMGVDGLRLDAVPYLYEREGTNCENLPETHTFLRKLRAHIDARFKGRMLLAEANQWPADAAQYYGAGDECHMNFHFPLMPRMFMAVEIEDSFPIINILKQTPAIPENCQWATFLRNHDELTLEMVTDEDRDYMYRVYAEERNARINLGIRRRLAPLMRTRRRIELMNALLFSLPGTPVLYYGDEIGMGDNIYLGDRDGVRTPMQWSSDRNAGFSRCNPQRLYLPPIVDPEYHYEAVNVEAQQSNPASMLWWMKRIIALRKQHKVFGRGSIEFLSPDNHRILAFIRSWQGQEVLVVANLSRHAQFVDLDLSRFKGRTPVELFGKTRFPEIGEAPYFLTLGPHDFFWFSLEHPAPGTAAQHARLPLLEVRGHFSNLLRDPGGRRALEPILLDYITVRRYFRSKARVRKGATIVDAIPLGGSSAAPAIMVVLMRVEYDSGPAETYVVPVAFATGERATQLEGRTAHAVIAALRILDPDAVEGQAPPAEGEGSRELEGTLHDALALPETAEMLLAFIQSSERLGGSMGDLVGMPFPFLSTITPDRPLKARLSEAEQSNTTVAFETTLALKVFRHVEEGINPEFEIGRFLTEVGFKNVPRFAGAIEYRVPYRDPLVLGMLQEFVPNQGDAWQITLESLDIFFDRVLSDETARSVSAPMPEGSFVARSRLQPPPLMHDLLGAHFIRVCQLGQRTAELHLALSSETRDAAFGREPFSTLHQQSLFQFVHTMLARNFDALRRRQSALPEGARRRAIGLLGREVEINDRVRPIISRKIDGVRIRCHGDLHLGQVLWTGQDFVFIDFEGEPARPLVERRYRRSPLRDVAGMLRSFDYAGAAALRSGRARPEDAPVLEHWVDAWVAWMSSAYLGGYLSTLGDAKLLPKSEADIDLLIEFYLFEKVLYEVGYEFNNRPDWLEIPLRGLERLLDRRT